MPLVVQIGFAGSRSLFASQDHPDLDADAFDAAVLDHLTERLSQLPRELGLSDQHFLCGISQVAIGADTVFTRACKALSIPQQLFLPQHRENYLAEVGSQGRPDFSPDQQRAARDLMDSAHIIHQRVVSDAASRHDRFKDANLEIVHCSDVLICLVRDAAESKQGGTRDLIERARKRGKPVLEITVSLKDRLPHFEQTWHGRDALIQPTLPHALHGLVFPPRVAPGDLPEVADYAGHLKNFTSAHSRTHSRLFKSSAFIIIGTHVIATVCAVIVLQVHEPSILPALLTGELLLLLAGFGVHEYLHRSEASHVWAVSRLLSELARSLQAVGRLPVYLNYLFSLPFPADLQPLLRTLSVLHLRSSAGGKGQPWEPLRDSYVQKRFTGLNAQLEFYERESNAAQRYRKLAQQTFVLFSVGAMIAALVKLLVSFGYLSMLPRDLTGIVGGSLAIVLPVLAVASLGLAAAFDLEARAHLFWDMLAFLEIQKDCLTSASSEREFAKLLLETESRLLGETLTWFTRRWFTGVA